MTAAAKCGADISVSVEGADPMEFHQEIQQEIHHEIRQEMAPLVRQTGQVHAQVFEGCLLPCSSFAPGGSAAAEYECAYVGDAPAVPYPMADSEVSRSSNWSQMSLLLASVRSIREMQSSLEEQLQRGQGELLGQIEALRASATPEPHPLAGFLCSAGELAPSGPNVRCVRVGSIASLDSPMPLQEFNSEVSPAKTSPSNKTSQLQRQDTHDYTQAALRRANLHQIDEGKQSCVTASPWHKMPQNMSDVRKKVHRSVGRRLLKWNGFDYAMGVVILLNSISIGWEISLEVEGNVSSGARYTLKTLEYAFLAIYTAELSLRLYVDQQEALKNSWVQFDCTIVFTGLVSAVIQEVSWLDRGVREATKQVTLLRIIRLLRLVRALRLVRQFKTLWRLVNGLLTSLDTMLWTLVLVVLVLYVAACIGVELIAGTESFKEKPDIANLVEDEFSTVPTTMLSLVQFVTMDDLSDLYKPIIREQPFMVVYFISILMIVSIALLNLVTAVLVEGALEKSRKDHEMEAINLRRQVKDYLPVARDLFRRMDADGSGVLTLDEIRQKLDDEDGSEELQRKLREVVPFESVLELFESLDIDGNGEIPEQEFVDGVLKSALEGRDNVELTQILRLLRIQGRKMEKIEARFARTFWTEGKVTLADSAASGFSGTLASGSFIKRGESWES